MVTSVARAGEARVHVFTNAGTDLFLKQFSGFDPVLDGVRFSFGLEVPDAIDALIVFTRASYSLPTTLPPERTVFVAAEPDVIHPYSARFLNQFGLVLSATDKPLETEQYRYPCCAIWFAGINFALSGKTGPQVALKGGDHFRALVVPEKLDKISIVTSSKTFTPYHRKRLAFIEALQRIIPDRIEMFGRGFRSVDDKADALLPYAYHLAIENGDGPDLWTEKLADPFLCWSFPFYAGCENVSDYFPSDSFAFVDLDDAEASARRMVAMIESGAWKRALPSIAEARERLFSTHSLGPLLARLANRALEKPVAEERVPLRLIRSERSLWPERGAKGSVPEWALRNLMLAIDKKAELRASHLQRWFELRRSQRRQARREREELARKQEV